MQEKFQLFYSWVLNQKPEISDPSNPFQCMDLAYEWVFFLNFPKDTIQHGYAYQVFSQPNSSTSQYFDLIPNSLTFVPQIGDLAVFDKTSTNIAGHIAVCTGEGDTNTFKSMDENWTANGIVTVITHNYTNPKLLGVLRPKPEKLTGTITDQTILPIIDANGNQMEVQAVRSKLADQDKQIANLLTDKDNLAFTVTALNAKISQLQEKVDNMPVNASEPSFNSNLAKLLYLLAKRIG